MKKARKELSPQDLEREEKEKRERKKRMADLKRMAVVQKERSWVSPAKKFDYVRRDELKEMVAKKITCEEDGIIRKLAEEELKIVEKRILNTEKIQACRRRKREEELARKRAEFEVEEERQKDLNKIEQEREITAALEQAKKDQEEREKVMSENLKLKELSKQKDAESLKEKGKEEDKPKEQDRRFWSDIFRDDSEEEISEKEDVKDGDFEGIYHMRKAIMEVEAGLPSTSKTLVEEVQIGERKVEVSMPGSSKVPCELELREDGDEEGDRTEELKKVEDYEDYIRKILDIQEEIVEITTAKDCRKEVGRSIRKEVRNMLEIVIKQQKALIYYKAKYEESIRQEKDTEVKETYADKIKKCDENKTDNRIKSRVRIPQYSVTILPKVESTSVSTREEVCRMVDVGLLKQGIRGVRSIGRGGIVVEVESEEDIGNLVKCVVDHKDIGEKYEAYKTPKRLPQIVMYNVDAEYSEEQLKKELVERNSVINDEEDIMIRKKYKGKVGNNWIIELKPKVFKEIIKEKKIYLRWQRHDVRENLRVNLCYSCGRPGHIGKNCRNKSLCTNCGSSDHKKEDCVSNTECINCKFSNSNWGTKYNIDHLCFSRLCPFYLRELDKLMKRTDYGT